MFSQQLEASGVFAGDSGAEVRSVYDAIVNAGNEPDNVARIFLYLNEAGLLNSNELERFKKALIPSNAAHKLTTERFFEIAEGIEDFRRNGLLARNDSNTIIDAYIMYLNDSLTADTDIIRFLPHPDKMAKLFMHLDKSNLLKEPFLSDYIKIVLDGRIALNLANDLAQIKHIFLGREGAENWAAFVKSVMEGGRDPHYMAVAFQHLNNLGYLNDNQGINRNALVTAALKRDADGRPDADSMNQALELMNVAENKQRAITIEGIQEEAKEGGGLDQFPIELVNLTSSFFKEAKNQVADDDEIKSTPSNNSPKNRS